MANDDLRNPELEQALLGAILIDPSALTDVTPILQPQDFSILRNSAIFQAALDVASRGAVPDYLTITEEAKKNGDGADPAYITGLFNATPTSLNALEYARELANLARRRRLVAEALEKVNYFKNRDNPLPDEEASRPRYTVHNAADALAPRAAVKWLVEGRIYEKSVTVMYGDGGTKKTWAGMYLAACVSSGAPWGDIETHKTRCLFVDEENGEDEISGRAAFCIRGALSDESADLRYISLAAFHLDDPKDEVILTAEILTQGAGLVILDALADLMLGDENTKQDTQPVFNALRRIAEKTGAAILVIHHANKQGGHRGSSVIKDAPDILLQVESDLDSNFINFKTEKNRKGKAVKWSMVATWTEDQFYLRPADAPEKTKPLSKSQEYVIRYLTEHGASPVPAIIAGADTCSPEAARKAVYNLADLRTIHRTNPGETGQGVAAIYDLAKAENE
jgi:hypothetical protein